jgi:hypothetical protein
MLEEEHFSFCSLSIQLSCWCIKYITGLNNYGRLIGNV